MNLRKQNNDPIPAPDIPKFKILGNESYGPVVQVNMMMKRIVKQISIVGILVALCPSAFACDVPVFSYAIQYWESDSYIAHVFHQDALTPEAQQILSLLNTGAVEERPVNIVVHTVDMEAPQDAGLLALYAAHLEGINPGLLIHYPAATRIRRPVYAGPLEESAIRRVIDSPARRELVKRLLRGDMAVWLLLESGDRRADNEAARMLETELARMARVLQLPAKDRWVWSEDIDADEGVRFSMLRIRRDAPEEKMLVRMLVESEPDLAERADAPMAFPVYGRGLILYALVGAGINEWTIADACEFLIGPCSCQVKASNPGTDLLLSMDWDRHIRSNVYSEFPITTGLAGFFERGEEAAARLADLDALEENGEDSLEAETPDAKRFVWLYIAIAVTVTTLLLLYIKGLFQKINRK